MFCRYARGLSLARSLIACPGSTSPTPGFTAGARHFQTRSTGRMGEKLVDPNKPGSAAFAECEAAVVKDLYKRFALKSEQGECYLDLEGVRSLLKSIGVRPSEETLKQLFQSVDLDNSGTIELDEFLVGADQILGDAPAGIVLVVGGPGSGKGILCDRLAEECAVVHLSSGDLLRDEVEKDTPLGRECAAIMARGELVSSAVIVTLVRRRMRAHPGKRVLLDGFPRSLQNAHDLVELCGVPELALHLETDDTILLERIINRGRKGAEDGSKRQDDNVDTALKRLRVYHKYHHTTIDFLREQHVPIVNLDCSGTPESVWNQLSAIGRLMRPVAQHRDGLTAVNDEPWDEFGVV